MIASRWTLDGPFHLDGSQDPRLRIVGDSFGHTVDVLVAWTEVEKNVFAEMPFSPHFAIAIHGKTWGMRRHISNDSIHDTSCIAPIGGN